MKSNSFKFFCIINLVYLSIASANEKTLKGHESLKNLKKSVEEMCFAIKKNDFNLASTYFDSSVANDKSKMGVVNYIKKEKTVFNLLCDEIKSAHFNKNKNGTEWIIDIQEDNEFYFGLKENNWIFFKHVNINEE